MGCDRLILPTMDALRGCAARQFGACGRPVCRFSRYYADHAAVAVDCDCECTQVGQHASGSAWVRWVQAQGSGVSKPAPCAGGSFTAVIELGVHRCAPVMDDARQPIADETWERFTAGMMDDVAALRRAPMCCAFLGDNDLKWQLQQVQPSGPTGGCASAVATISVEFVDCGCPEGVVRA